MIKGAASGGNVPASTMPAYFGIRVLVSAQQAYSMLGNDSLWQVAVTCHRTLAEAGLPHAVVGGVAVCLHGYRRNTVDLDLLVRPADQPAIREVLTAAGFSGMPGAAEFRSPESVPIRIVLAADRAGAGSEVRLPDPADRQAVTEREGLPVLTLAKLIESKLACGQGSPRRTHKDFADVVELIAVHDLSRSFARHLHTSLGPTFRELVLRACGEA